jgi:hypothetical protein
LKKLELCEVVTKAVQKSNITFSDVRDYFASLCKRFPEMEELESMLRLFIPKHLKVPW